MINRLDVREDYTEEENIEDQILRASHEGCKDIINNYKNLWIKVIRRAINDVALMTINIPKWELKLPNIKNEKKYKKIELEIEKMYEIKNSALEFLFNPNYLIPWSDFEITVKCPRCLTRWKDLMSNATEFESKCSRCNYKISSKYIQYRIEKENKQKEITLEGLLDILEIFNVENFREKAKLEIEQQKKETN